MFGDSGDETSAQTLVKPNVAGEIFSVGTCKDPRYRSLQLHLGQKTTMLGPHVRASDSSIYKVLTVRSSQDL